ncbi:pleckstrin homology domain-containing family N member 1 isoform X3 [Corvus kubaryi]|uniref:pleckstrin homology domain-containing family N member 1 isoform X3 n=1 Tax=Corvus kubaryi TaxID=68294 RepID=UPI001C03BFA9|nr:pleckstrin homology domain-containing family N member 1 isoform X3 [Corvus kubaryi]
MGNIACVPQAPGGFRSSFRRKPSLKKEQNGKKKLPNFFGMDGGQERDTTTDKILQYIPAKATVFSLYQNQENQKENLDQRFPSLFKKGRRKTTVRNLGKMIYYSKVKFKFQHCQEVNDCFLELFQSYLYFQSAGPNGLTYQGLLPLKELQVRELEAGQSPGRQDHALHISGPLLNPLVVFCPSEAELKQWLYHLEKQIQLCGGSLALPLLSQSGWKQSPGGKEELRWSVQNLPVQDWRGTQRESLGEILCISKVKLQHLPFQEQHDRLLVLYPSTLVIMSEEPSVLCFKGELPLNAIQVLFEDNNKTSFLIEGRLINSIRVTCPSYQDYQEWLYCLKTAQFRNADSSLSGSESFSGSKPPHPSQFTSSGRGSLSSDGRTNSWASAGRVTTLTQLSQPSGSLPDGHSFLLLPEGRLLEEPLSPGYSQPLHCLAQPSWPSTALPTQDLRRGNSARKSKGKSSGQQLPNQDPKRSGCGLIPANPNGELQSPVYHEPYAAHCPQQHPPAHLELGRFLQCHGQTGPAQGNPAVPAPQHPSLEHWNCREVPTAPTYSTPGTSRQLQLRALAQGSYLGEISSLPEERLGPSLHPADGSGGTYGLADAACPCRDSSSYHDYAELQSFQSDLSYDNLWEAEEKELGTPCSSPSPAQQIYQV